MHSLENITAPLKDKRVIVTGCSYKPVRETFTDIVTGKPSHDGMLVNNKEMKLNIGSAVAGVLAKSGAHVHMISTSEDKLKNIKNGFGEFVDEHLLSYSAIDLLSEQEVQSFVKDLPSDKGLYWVQSVGLGAGSYKLKDDNPYLSIDKIPLDLIENESKIVLRATHLMMRELLPLFREQDETRIAVITSMSAVRSYAYGATHCAAKGAIDRYANAAMLELYKDNIYLTSIRPGAVDTGMYDGQAVQKAVMSVCDEYSCDWREKGIRLAPPRTVGEAINYVFTTPAHIPSINLVAKGQFPHEGS